MTESDNEKGWVSGRISNARAKLDVDVPDVAAELLKSKLADDLQRRSLRAPELKALAEELISVNDSTISADEPEQCD